MTRLLVIGLDATIVFDHSVSLANCEAMTRRRAADNLLVVSIGKFSFATRNVLVPLGVDFGYGVVFTGAVPIDSDYQVFSARYLLDGVARDVVACIADLPGVTTYVTAIETGCILADDNEKISSILAVFEYLSLEEMGAHRFIGVPLRVTNDALCEYLRRDLIRCWEGVPDCHRNQKFLDPVPVGATEGTGLHALLDGSLTGRDIEVWIIGNSWNDLDIHAVADHVVALPWSPLEMTATCEAVMGSVVKPVVTILEGDRHE